MTTRNTVQRLRNDIAELEAAFHANPCNDTARAWQNLVYGLWLNDRKPELWSAERAKVREAVKHIPY